MFQKNSVKELNESIKQVSKNLYSRNSKGETKLHSACAKVNIKSYNFHLTFLSGKYCKLIFVINHHFCAKSDQVSKVIHEIKILLF